MGLASETGTHGILVKAKQKLSVLGMERFCRGLEQSESQREVIML